MLEQILLAAMLSWSPPSEHWREDPAVTEWRYARIAETIAEVSRDACAQGRGLPGGSCPERTALVLAAIASLESHFREDVDTCKVGGDNMTSWSIFQLAGRRDLCRDRREAAMEALRLAVGSVRRCGDLTEYVSGSCGRGRTAAAARWARAKKTLDRLQRSAYWFHAMNFDSAKPSWYTHQGID